MLRPDGAIVRGRLRSIDSSAVVLYAASRGSTARRVELQEIEALDVYRGRAGAARTIAGAAAYTTKPERWEPVPLPAR